MILQFRKTKINGQKLQKICEDKTIAIKTLGIQQAKKLFLLITEISLLEIFDDMYSLPHFEQLRGERKNEYSLRITANYRLILTKIVENNQSVLILNIEDYH